MMPACRIALLIVALVAGPVSASEFTIDDWELDVSVLPPSGSGTGDYIPGVVNPFTDSHQVELGVSSASAAYDFGWDGTGGHFSIDSQLAAEVLSNGTNRANSHGWIKITPSVDLAVHVDASFDYNLPTNLLEAMLDVYSGKFQHTLFDEYREHDTLSDGIGSGTLSFSGDFVMPAGELWSMDYGMRLRTDAWSPGAAGQIATGSGSVCFTIQALPEPGTLSLALLGSMMLLRRQPSRVP